MNVLGVKIDELDKDAALKKCEDFLNHEGQNLIFTPNPEILVKASRDKNFTETLNSASLNICDGFGLYVAARIRGKTHRITGVDFMLDICKIAERRGDSIFLLGSGDEKIVENAKNHLLIKFPKLKIVGVGAGPRISETNGEIIASDDNQNCIDLINQTKPKILFVAFGMGKQEKWLQKYLTDLPSVKIGMAVGGAFDFVSGKISRAPLLMRRFGLEWAYRLFKQPNRIGRILNATIMFTVLYIKESFHL